MAGLTAIVMNKINYDNVIVTCNRQHASTLCVHTPIRDEDYFNNVRAYRWPVNVIGGINQKDISVFHISMSILYFKLLNHSWSSRNPERGEKYYYFELKGYSLKYNAVSEYFEAYNFNLTNRLFLDFTDDVTNNSITEVQQADNEKGYIIHDYKIVYRIRCESAEVWTSRRKNTNRLTSITRFEKYGTIFLDLLFKTRNDVELLVTYIMVSRKWVPLDIKKELDSTGFNAEPVAGTSRDRQSRRAHPYDTSYVLSAPGGRSIGYYEPVSIILDINNDIQSTSIVKVDAYSYNADIVYTYLSHVSVNINEAYSDGVQIFKELEYPPFLLIYSVKPRMETSVILCLISFLYINLKTSQMAGLTAIVMNKINYDNVIVTCNRQHASTLCVHTPIRDEDYFNNVRAYRWPVNVIGGINQKDISVFHISMSILYFKLLNHSWSSRNPERGEKYYYFEIKDGYLSSNAIVEYFNAYDFKLSFRQVLDLENDFTYNSIKEIKHADNEKRYIIHDYVVVYRIKCDFADVWKSHRKNTNRLIRITRFEKYGNVFLDLLFKTRNDVELLVTYIMVSRKWVPLDIKKELDSTGFNAEPVAGTSRGRQSRRAHPYDTSYVLSAPGGRSIGYYEPVSIILDINNDIQSTSIVKVDVVHTPTFIVYTFLTDMQINIMQGLCNGVQIYKELTNPPFLIIYNTGGINELVYTFAFNDDDIVLRRYNYNTISSKWEEESNLYTEHDLYIFIVDTAAEIDHRLYTQSIEIIANTITTVYISRGFIGFAGIIIRDLTGEYNRFLEGVIMKKVFLQETVRYYVYINEGIEFVVEDTRLPSGEWNEGTLPGEIYLGNV
ncbi:hypothetical protein BdWA1_002615 [Babesia duncani]|uniref:Uncharacterized protein n=1 Tax=Babesia duncani TaxID=323732 RepID=A0AAD9UNN7_9APIC|nr:hypothetical protein BdWA1_004203 [Babesia duncani]KAK2194841.1 hypothetical protein BdWA1_003682 [Babesia duncani]KAK2196017.1 hypothetical protein BdWA1_002615 [Babesia duncani]